MDCQIESMGHGPTMAKDLDLGKKVLDVLEKWYAGHAWMVDTNHESGHCTIQLMYERGGKAHIWKYGFLFHIKSLMDSDLEKKVKNAGGECLERYHMQRGKFSITDMINFREHGVDTQGMIMESRA